MATKNGRQRSPEEAARREKIRGDMSYEKKSFEAYRAALPEYRPYFKRIEFAVYCRKYETGNFDAFNAVLSQM